MITLLAAQQLSIAANAEQAQRTLVFVLISLSFFIDLTFMAVRTRRAFITILVVRHITVLAIGIAFHEEIGIAAIPFLIMVLEIALYTDHPVNALLCAAAIIGFLPLLLQPMLSPVWSSATETALCFVTLFSSVVISLAGCILTRHRENVSLLFARQRRMSDVIADLTKANLRHLELAQTTEERSILSERRRLTAELHDLIGYTLTNLAMMMEAAKDLVEDHPDALSQLIDVAREQALRGMEDARKSLRLLRAQGISAPGGLAAIERMSATFQAATGVTVERHYANFPNTCGAEIDEAFSHFVQEGLINAFRHGKATRIRTVFSADEKFLRAWVTDNGCGCPMVVEGIGITGMRERLGGLGGTLAIETSAGSFTIQARVPLDD